MANVNKTTSDIMNRLTKQYGNGPVLVKKGAISLAKGKLSKDDSAMLRKIVGGLAHVVPASNYYKSDNSKKSKG